MLKNELITVVIPVYNTQKYLKKCVDSFVNQTYKNIEIILVDDGSTDKSPQMCDEYAKSDSRIIVIHKKNGGLSDARNVGINNAKGSMILFYDSDDYVDIDYIEYLYDLKKKYNTQISVCGFYTVSPNGTKRDNKVKDEECLLSKKEFFKRMLNEEGITVSATEKLYDLELFIDVRYPIGKLCEDNGTTYKLIDKVEGEIAYGSEAKSYYNLHPGSIMRSKFNKRKLDIITLNDEMCDYLDEKYPDLNNITLRRRVYSRFNVLRQMEYCDEELKKTKLEIINYIKLHKKFILHDKSVPKRDKFACALLLLGEKFFYLSWKFYSKVKYVI